MTLSSHVLTFRALMQHAILQVMGDGWAKFDVFATAYLYLTGSYLGDNYAKYNQSNKRSLSCR